MGRAAQQIFQHGAGVSGDALLQRTLLGYDLLYLLRGAPVVYYGDEVGMIGSGGDKAAREDMFPTQVPDWQTEPRVGSPPIGNGLVVRRHDNPIQARLRDAGDAAGRTTPRSRPGASIVRYAKGAVLVVCRIDAAKKRELVVAFNNGDTAGAGAGWRRPPPAPGAGLRRLGGDPGVERACRSRSRRRARRCT